MEERRPSRAAEAPLLLRPRREEDLLAHEYGPNRDSGDEEHVSDAAVQVRGLGGGGGGEEGRGEDGDDDGKQDEEALTVRKEAEFGRPGSMQSLGLRSAGPGDAGGKTKSNRQRARSRDDDLDDAATQDAQRGKGSAADVVDGGCLAALKRSVGWATFATARGSSGNGAGPGKGEDEPTDWGGKARELVATLFPIVATVKGYDKESFQHDLVGGLTMAGVLIPQGMAYASLANLPEQYGLYASITPLLIYAALGRVTNFSFGPFALISLLVASSLSGAGFSGCKGGCSGSYSSQTGDDREYINAVMTMTFMVGVFYWLLAAFRLSVIATFLADPVMSGFKTAAAFLIALSQLQKFTQVDIDNTDTLVAGLTDFFTGIEGINGYAVLLGSFNVAFILGLVHLSDYLSTETRKIKLPSHLIAMIVSIVIAVTAKIDEAPFHVHLVGHIPSGLPAFRAPNFVNVGDIVEPAVSVGLISFIISLTLLKANPNLDVNAELRAMGVSNVFGSFVSVYPSCGSLSRTSLLQTLHVKTPIHNVVTATTVILALYLLTAVFEKLPDPCLAAIIFVALVKLVDFDTPKKLYHEYPTGMFVWVVTFLATLVFGVQLGITIGVAISLVMLLQATARPSAGELGRIPGTNDWRDRREYHGALDVLPDILVHRFGASLHFANKEYFESNLHAILRLDTYDSNGNANGEGGDEVSKARDSEEKKTAHEDTEAGGGRTSATASIRTSDAQELRARTVSRRGPWATSSLRRPKPPPRIIKHLVLDWTSVFDVDPSACVAVKKVIKAVQKKDISVHICSRPDSLRVVMKRNGLKQALVEMGVEFFVSLEDAIMYAEMDPDVSDAGSNTNSNNSTEIAGDSGEAPEKDPEVGAE